MAGTSGRIFQGTGSGSAASPLAGTPDALATDNSDILNAAGSWGGCQVRFQALENEKEDQKALSPFRCRTRWCSFG